LHKNFGFSLGLIVLFFLSASKADALGLEGVGGWEEDSHASGFAFYGLSGTYTLRDPIALLGKVEGSYLYYQYGSSDDLTRVTSPGVRLMSGIKVQLKGSMGFLLGGVEQRWNRTVERSSTGVLSAHTDPQRAAVVQGMIDARLSKAWSMNLFADYGAANHYRFTRLALKRQVHFGPVPPGILFLGIEGIAQGNKDIFTVQEGGLIELHLGRGPASVMVKAGNKESWSSDHSHQGGAYVGIGLYTQFK